MVEEKTLVKKTIEQTQDIACFVLRVSDKTQRKPWVMLDLLGKPVFEWVTKICPSLPVTLECFPESKTLSVIKPYLKNREYTLVLFGDTPLLSKQTVLRAIKHLEDDGLNVCALPRGYVFRTEYIRRVDDVYAPQVYGENNEEYLCVDSNQNFMTIKEILRDKIFNFHEDNGVEFIDRKSTYVDSDVRIGGGVIVEPNTLISGKTEIYENAKIGFGSVIKSSKIGAGSEICGSEVISSVIKENVKIKGGAHITEKTFVGANSIVSENVVLVSASIANNVNIGANSYLVNAKVYNDASVGANSTLVGTGDNPVRIKEGEKLSLCSIIENKKNSNENNIFTDED